VEQDIKTGGGPCGNW